MGKLLLWVVIILVAMVAIRIISARHGAKPHAPKPAPRAPARQPGSGPTESMVNCAHCGIYTFHQRRSSPDEYGINAACIEGTSPFDFAEVPVSDGVHHPKDRPGGAAPAAGWLRFEANPAAQGD